MPKQDDLVSRSLGRNSPKDRGSRRSSRDILNWDYDSNPESDNYRRRDRPSRKMSIRDRNFFTDALDDLEISIRKFEEESGILLHDFNVIRNQHQSQVKRMNDLLRHFEETRYRIDRINSRGYRRYGSDLTLDSASELRGSSHSLDRSEKTSSFRDEVSSSRGSRSRSYRTDSPVDRDYGSAGDGDI